MQYTDAVYGTFSIENAAILELLESPTMQRLKHISQAGYFEPFYPGSYHTRFEHSVGDYYLLKHFNASLEEQIAGLIHDVSHSAFSHCIDYIGTLEGQKNQTHQDSIFETFVKNSEIPKILQNHSLDIDFILTDSNFPLKETQIPDLCTDRMDYILRAGIMHKEIGTKEVHSFLENITATDGKWIFKNYESALWFAEFFSKISDVYFSNIESAVMLSTVAAYLKQGLEKKYITLDDIYTTDTQVLEKMKPFHETDNELKILFERMNNKIPFENNPNDYTDHVFCKSRVVDPLFFQSTEIKRVSEVNSEWKEKMEFSKKPKEYFLKFAR